MPEVSLRYVDDALRRTGAAAEDDDLYPFWRHFHWGLYDDPDTTDDSAAGYYAAAVALTDHMLEVAGVGDGARVLDVGCGFGGTLDHVRQRNRGCRLVGLNIDERQVRRARELLAPESHDGTRISFVTGDGCRLPVADASVDHVLAVECVFHFPSRKAFLREAARVLRPGGTLTLSDLVMGAGSLATVLARWVPDTLTTADASAAATGAEAEDPAAARAVDKLKVAGSIDSQWYGRFARPLTSAGYARLARGAGFDVEIDDDITRRTLPTYTALRRMTTAHDRSDAGDASDAGDHGQPAVPGAEPTALTGVAITDALAELGRSGDLGYHVLAFRRRA